MNKTFAAIRNDLRGIRKTKYGGMIPDIAKCYRGVQRNSNFCVFVILMILMYTWYTAVIRPPQPCIFKKDLTNYCQI